METLTNAHRATGLDPATTGSSHCQTSTTGAADTPQTSVWTATSDAIVQVMRHAATTRDGTIRQPAEVTGVSHA
jgi:hypothetical protein